MWILLFGEMPPVIDGEIVEGRLRTVCRPQRLLACFTGFLIIATRLPTLLKQIESKINGN